MADSCVDVVARCGIASAQRVEMVASETSTIAVKSSGTSSVASDMHSKLVEFGCGQVYDCVIVHSPDRNAVSRIGG